MDSQSQRNTETERHKDRDTERNRQRNREHTICGFKQVKIKNETGSGEMAQCVECLPCKQEDVSVIPELGKKTQTPWGQRQAGPWDSLANFRPLENTVSKNIDSA